MRSKWCGLGVLLAVIVSGCGGGGSGNGLQRVTLEATPAAMQRAATATTARTSKVDMTMSMSMLGQQFQLTATGAMDPANQRFIMSMDMRDLFEGIARTSGRDLPASLSSFLDEPMTMVMDGSVMYMHFAALASELPGGKEWMKIDIEKAAGVSDLFGASGSGVGNDPGAMLQFLQGTDDVTEVGREEIRGEQTTHYHGSYTLQDALAKAPEGQAEKLQEAMKNLGATAALDVPIPFDAWIGDDGLVRRFDMTMDLGTFMPKSSSLAGGALVSYSMEFHDFGTSVDIDLPSDDEVADMTDMLPRQSKFSSVANSIN